MLKAGKKINWSRTFFIIAHLLLGVVVFLVLYVYVNVQSFVMAFQRAENGVTYFTLENFQTFFELIGEGGILLEGFRNTFSWFLLSMALTVVSYFISYFLYRKIWGYKIFRVIFFIPSLISQIVMAYIFISFVDPSGFIARLIQRANGFDYVPELLHDSRYALKTLMIRSVLFGVAGNMLLLCGTMSRIPDSVLEAGRLDGVSWLREMWQIVIPMILPTIAITVCTSLAGIFSANGGEFLYTKGDFGTMTYNTWLYLQIYDTPRTSNTHNVAAAAGWITSLVSVPLVIVTRMISRKASEGTEY